MCKSGILGIFNTKKGYIAGVYESLGYAKGCCRVCYVQVISDAFLGIEMNQNYKQPSRKEAELAERRKRGRLITRARKGDDKALSELRKKHSVTKVWTDKEIKRYNDNGSEQE